MELLQEKDQFVLEREGYQRYKLAQSITIKELRNIKKKKKNQEKTEI